MNEGEKGNREWREERETDIEHPDILVLVLVLAPVPMVPGLALLVPTAVLQFLSYSSVYPMQPHGGGRF